MSVVSSKIYTSDSPLYLGPGSTNTPGITNLYYAPYELVESLGALAKADAVRDKEGLAENGIRVLSTPFSFTHSVASVAWYGLTGGVFFKVLEGSWNSVLTPLSNFMAGLGLVICAIEGVLESIGLTRTLQFKFKHVFPDEKNDSLTRLKSLQRDYFQISPKQLKKINQYIEKNLSHRPLEEQAAKRKELIDTALEEKKNDLIRRVHPWLAQEIETSLPEMIQDLEGYSLSAKEKAQKKAKEIFENLKVQTQKKILIHSLGLAAVALTIAGLILSLVACPALVPLIVLGVGSAFSFARYFAYVGLMDSKGWDFKVANCIPTPIKWIYNKITYKPKPTFTPIRWHFDLSPKTLKKPKVDYKITLRI